MGTARLPSEDSSEDRLRGKSVRHILWAVSSVLVVVVAVRTV